MGPGLALDSFTNMSYQHRHRASSFPSRTCTSSLQLPARLCPCLVATNGSSAKRVPKTRSVATDTTCALRFSTTTEKLAGHAGEGEGRGRAVRGWQW